eukprot:600002-Hanusia_phi.AAC.5
MHLTHTDGHTRLQVWGGGRSARPYLQRNLRVHYGCGQCVRVYDEDELKIVARMLSAYYNFESEQDDGLKDPFFTGSMWNSSLFTFHCGP